MWVRRLGSRNSKFVVNEMGSANETVTLENWSRRLVLMELFLEARGQKVEEETKI